MKKIVTGVVLMILSGCNKIEKKQELSVHSKDSLKSDATVTIKEAPVSSNQDSIKMDTKVDLSKSITTAGKATKEEIKEKVDELRKMKPTEKKKLVDVLPKSIFEMPVEIGKEIVLEGFPIIPVLKVFM